MLNSLRYLRGRFVIPAVAVCCSWFAYRSFSSPASSPSLSGSAARLSTRLAHLNSLFPPRQLAMEREWLGIRDLCFGDNWTIQDVPQSLKLAAACEHPEAQRLKAIFAGKTVKTAEDARRVFLALGPDDMRGLLYSELVASIYCVNWDLERFRRSALLGFPFAQGKLASLSEGEEGLKYARAAVHGLERDGFYWFAKDFMGNDDVTARDLEVKEAFFLVAAELGDVWSMGNLGSLMDETDPQRWIWWGQAAQRRNSHKFLENFGSLVRNFNSGSGQAACMFAVGQALSGHVDTENREIFWDKKNFDARLGPANDAIAYYESQRAMNRK